MLKIASYDIVFQEVPNETTLALNISNCPIRCKGCHSPHLMEDIGEPLNIDMIKWLMNKYGNEVTCICFMGGDSSVKDINELAHYIKDSYGNNKRVAWYSGEKKIKDEIDLSNFDYIKIGPFIEKFGGLKSADTNQRFYKIINCELIDVTYLFQKKHSAI